MWVWTARTMFSIVVVWCHLKTSTFLIERLHLPLFLLPIATPGLESTPTSCDLHFSRSLSLATVRWVHLLAKTIEFSIFLQEVRHSRVMLSLLLSRKVRRVLPILLALRRRNFWGFARFLTSSNTSARFIRLSHGTLHSANWCYSIGSKENSTPLWQGSLGCQGALLWPQCAPSRSSAADPSD